MKSFYCRYNENKQVPFTAGKIYKAFQAEGSGFNVFDDKRNVRFLHDDNGTAKFVVGCHNSGFENCGFYGWNRAMFAEFEVFN